MTTDVRKGLLAKIHIAKAQLALDDEAYRAVLARYGADSAAELDLRGLESVLTHMETLGWRGKRAGDKHGAPKNLGRGRTKGNVRPYDRSALMTKIEALLADKAATQGGYVPWDYAAAILRRMYGVERLEWATPDQLRGVIAALRRGGRRKGGRRGPRNTPEGAGVTA